MSQQELLTKVIRVLDSAGIQYMVTGSIASSLQGEPRTTHDVDIVVDINSSSVKELLKAFPSPDFYLDQQSIIEAINKKGMFNLIEVNTGDKIDFWLITDEPFDRSRFSRKCIEEVMGIQLFVSTPEDTILAKLRWAKRSGGSEKHFTDALRVYEVQHENLDMHYLRTWAKKLGVEKLLERLEKEAEFP
jgi:hypothetical protein